MYVNCAHGKGIKFIREDLKFFAKTHINSNNGDLFKSVVLLNADKLTMDAQSALRRCIELFSHNTRFFIVVEEKYNLLKPILSRFCEIYIPETVIHNKIISLHKYNTIDIYTSQQISNKKIWLKKEITKVVKDKDNTSFVDLSAISIKFYEKGYSALDLLSLLENDDFMKNEITMEKRYQLLITFSKIKKEFRNEKILMFFILYFILFGLYYDLENISFM
jgi:DNA polymerase III delta prime subunit